jgi:uncharacterized membrane protein HdeD (DUF308 family)
MRAVAAPERWGPLLAEGIFGIAAAVITFFWPRITVFGLVIVIAAWAIITGIAEIAAAVLLRRHISSEWLLVVGGIASIVFGVLVASVPAAGALVIALWFGAYARRLCIVIRDHSGGIGIPPEDVGPDFADRRPYSGPGPLGSL